MNAAKTLTTRQATAKVHEMAKSLVEAMRHTRAKDDLILSHNARMLKRKAENKINVSHSNDADKEANSLSAHVPGFLSPTPILPLNKIALKATV